MSNSITDVINLLSEAERMMQSGQSGQHLGGRQPDLDEDFKEVVKEAIYEVREEQWRESQSGSRSGSESQSGSSGSSTLRQLMMAVGFAAAGYMAYKRRQSQQTPTHLEHSGQTRHTSPSDLPEAETRPNEPEPTSGESSGS